MVNYVIGFIILCLLVLAIRHAVKGHHCSACGNCGKGVSDCGCGKVTNDCGCGKGDQCSCCHKGN